MNNWFKYWPVCKHTSHITAIDANLKNKPHCMTTLKRKTSYVILADKGPKVKKLKFKHLASDLSDVVQLSVPLGIRWQNNSCAYDTVFTVLFNVW